MAAPLVLSLGLAGLLAGCCGVGLKSPGCSGQHYLQPKAVIEIRGGVSESRPQVLRLWVSKKVAPDPDRIYLLGLPQREARAFLVERGIAVSPLSLLTPMGGGAAYGTHVRDSLAQPRVFEIKAPGVPVAPFLLDFDPFDAGQRVVAVSTLAAVGIRLSVELPPAGTGVPRNAEVLTTPQQRAAVAGVLRHPLVPVGLVLDFRPCCPRVERLSVIVPDRRVLMQLAEEAAAPRAQPYAETFSK